MPRPYDRAAKLREAFEAGSNAARARRTRASPYAVGDAARDLRRQWLAGFDSVADLVKP